MRPKAGVMVLEWPGDSGGLELEAVFGAACSAATTFWLLRGGSGVQKANGAVRNEPPRRPAEILLDSLDVLCLPALGALDDVELNALTFLKRTEAVRLDGGVMHEHVIAILTADKSEALGIVKPFYCSLFHYSCSS
jgi:hypothetical protein